MHRKYKKKNRCMFVPSNTLNVKRDNDAKFFFVNEIGACIVVVFYSFPRCSWVGLLAEVSLRWFDWNLLISRPFTQASEVKMIGKDNWTEGPSKKRHFLFLKLKKKRLTLSLKPHFLLHLLRHQKKTIDLGSWIAKQFWKVFSGKTTKVLKLLNNNIMVEAKDFKRDADEKRKALQARAEV